MVCDGVGSSNQAADAAEKAAEILGGEDLIRRIENIDNDDTLTEDEKDQKIRAAILAALREANEEISTNTNGETTVAFAYLRKSRRVVDVAWVGDSRVYYFGPNRQLRLITADHGPVLKAVQTQERQIDAVIPELARKLGLSRILDQKKSSKAFSLRKSSIIASTFRQC